MHVFSFVEMVIDIDEDELILAAVVTLIGFIDYLDLNLELLPKKLLQAFYLTISMSLGFPFFLNLFFDCDYQYILKKGVGVDEVANIFLDFLVDF